MKEDDPSCRKPIRIINGGIRWFLLIFLVFSGLKSNGQEEMRLLDSMLQNASSCVHKNLFKEALHWCELAENSSVDRSSASFMNIEFLKAYCPINASPPVHCFSARRKPGKLTGTI